MILYFGHIQSKPGVKWSETYETAEHCPGFLVSLRYQCRVLGVVDAGTVTGSQPRLLWDEGTMFPRELSLPHLCLRLSPQKHDLSHFCSFVLLRYISDMPPRPASDTEEYPCFNLPMVEL